MGLPIVYVALTLFFVFLGFPYERVAGGLIHRVEEATGVSFSVDELGPYLSLFGPGFEATGVVAEPRNGAPVTLDRLRLRAAWSLSWLRGDPAVHLGVESALGAASGALVLGDLVGWDGEISDLDLSAPALRELLPIQGLDGRLWADADVEIVEGLPVGDVAFSIGEGSIAIPNSPLAVPFETVTGELVFGGESSIRIDTLDVRGPMLDGSVTGRVGDGSPGANLARAPLDLAVAIDVKEKMIRSSLRDLGVRLDRDGKASFNVGGNVSSPRVQ